MTETYEELDAELVSATNEWSILTSEYTARNISNIPLDDGHIPMLPMAGIEELTHKLQAAKERYDRAGEKMSEYRRTYPDEEK